MKKIGRIIFVVILAGALALLVFAPIIHKNTEEKRPKIVATTFVAYDLARSIIKDSYLDVEMLLAPGSDLHSYEPSPQDIIKIKESDVFIYNGGESEEWIEKIINEIDLNKTTIIKMMDAVELVEEDDDNILESEEEESEEAEYDEHIWTSPKNVQKICSKITSVISEKYPQYQDIFTKNLAAQNNALKQLDQDFTDLAKTKTGTIIMADRFPLRYFVDAYGFDYLAAFPGCSEQTEANAKTISILIDKVKSTNAQYIFHIELSNQKIANTVKDATGVEVLEFHSMHNISQADFDAGKTYIDLMKQNYQNLSKALHDVINS